MVGKNFIKRGLVVGLVALAAIGMLATSGFTRSSQSGAAGRVGPAATSSAQGQNGQCDRGGYAAEESFPSIMPGQELIAARISSYKHPCAGPMLFTASAQLPPGLWSVRVRATCVSGCSGTFWGDPGGSGTYYIGHNQSSAGAYQMYPYSGGFPNLPVGLYNVDLLLQERAGINNNLSIRSIHVQSYAAPTQGGGGIGG